MSKCWMNLSSGPAPTLQRAPAPVCPAPQRSQSRYGNSFLQEQMSTEVNSCEEAPAVDLCGPAESAPEPTCEAPPPEPVGLCTTYGNFLVWPDETMGPLAEKAPDGSFQVFERQVDPLLAELDAFHASCDSAPNFQPSTGPGIFDAGFTPGPGAGGVMTVSVRFAFSFVAAQSPGDYPTADAAALDWTDDAEKEAWKTNFFSAVSGAWGGAHRFAVLEPYWEQVQSSVELNLYEDTSSPHYTLTVQKIPAGEFAGSAASAARTGSTQGSATMDSEDLTPATKAGGNQQRGAVHEFGHMIGLGDEYAGKATPRHNASFEAAGGATIATGDDDRIMSGGETVLQEHYITFLEGLRAATARPTWGYAP